MTKPMKIAPWMNIQVARPASSNVTVTGIGVYDALTGGNLLMWSKLVTSKELANGDTISFANNAIVFTIN